MSRRRTLSSVPFPFRRLDRTVGPEGLPGICDPGAIKDSAAIDTVTANKGSPMFSVTTGLLRASLTT
jgi:hypothetical protein